jgi:hypothetical protein
LAEKFDDPSVEALAVSIDAASAETLDTSAEIPSVDTIIAAPRRPFPSAIKLSVASETASSSAKAIPVAIASLGISITIDSRGGIIWHRPVSRRGPTTPTTTFTMMGMSNCKRGSSIASNICDAETCDRCCTACTVSRKR